MLDKSQEREGLPHPKRKRKREREREENKIEEQQRESVSVSESASESVGRCCSPQLRACVIHVRKRPEKRGMRTSSE